MRTIQARYISGKRVNSVSKVWAPIFCLFSFLWLTGCLKSLDPQLTPFISSVTPDTTTLGATIAVKGSNFSFLNAATSVSLVIRGEGDTLTVDNPTIKKSESGENEIQLVLPNIPAGKYQVFLLVKDREGDRRSNEVPITILTFGPTSIEPARGPAGTIVTIRGNGLKNTKKLLFRGANTIEVTPLSPPTDQEVRVVVPEGASSGSIRMQMEGIILEPETSEFRVTLPPPTVSLLQPAKGTVGTKVVISGTHFGPVYGNAPLFSRKVTFAGPNGTRLTSTLTTVNVADSTDKKIIAVVPEGAITGQVIVEIDSVVAAQKPVFTVEEIVADKQVVWIEGQVIKVASIQKDKPVTISNFYENTDYTITALSADQVNERLYFFGTDLAGQSFIRSLNFKGKDEKLFLSQAANIDRIKVAGAHVYWQQGSTYYRAPLTNPSNKQEIYSVAEGSAYLYAFSVSATEEYLYWLEQDANGITDIKRRRADGTGTATTIFKGPEINNGDGSSIEAFSASIEAFADRLYVTATDFTSGLPLVFTGNANGTGSLLSNAVYGMGVYGFAIDEKEKKLYWSALDETISFFVLQRGEMNGTKKEVLFNSTDQSSYPSSVFEVF